MAQPLLPRHWIKFEDVYGNRHWGEVLEIKEHGYSHMPWLRPTFTITCRSQRNEKTYHVDSRLVLETFSSNEDQAQQLFPQENSHVANL